MKKTAVAGSLAALCLLCSCAQTAQGKSVSYTHLTLPTN